MGTAYESASYTPGSGRTAAIQDVNSKDVPIVAVDISGGGASELPLVGREVGTSTKDGALYVDARPKLARIQASNTPAASSHAVMDAVGGLYTLASVVRFNGASGEIRTVTLHDQADTPTKFACDVVFFRASVTATDDAVFAPTDGQVDDYIGHVSFTSADWAEFDVNAAATKQCSIPFEAAAASQTIYAVVVVRSAATTFAASAIKVTAVVYQD